MKNNFHKSREMDKKISDELIIYGRHAVISALKNPKRRIKKLIIAAENRGEIEQLEIQVVPTVIDKKDFSKFLPQDAVHQGFALYCQRLESVALEDLMAMSDEI